MSDKAKRANLGVAGEALSARRANSGASDEAPSANRSFSGKAKRALSITCEMLGVCVAPAVMAACLAFGVTQTAVLTFIAAVGALVCFFGAFELSRPRLREIMPVTVMAALAVAGRIIFAALPSVKPVTAITIAAGASFGRRSGFLVGALAALVSNFFFGQGPWTPWQMYAWGLVGWGAGLLVKTKLFSHPIGVCAYGFVGALLYGFIINSWSIFGFFQPDSFVSALAVYFAALPYDVVHGVATVVFLAILYLPLQRKAERIKLKYALER